MIRNRKRFGVNRHSPFAVAFINLDDDGIAIRQESHEQRTPVVEGGHLVAHAFRNVRKRHREVSHEFKISHEFTAFMNKGSR